ncbi:MAG: hypothetical protein HY290_03375 [Planctomycetia bacterium]|nr:hypothetical protein [Planctomycetia bacterium]
MPSTPTRDRLAWLAIAATLLLVAWFSLRRVENGNLFLIRLPFDRDPYALEIHDATVTAHAWLWPALAFLAIGAAAIAARNTAFRQPARRTGFSRSPVEATRILWQRLRDLVSQHPRFCAVFAAACTADFLSTLYFFHTRRIDDELHPGIKLFTYAYGLSIGCLAGKAIQALLALSLCAVFPKAARTVLPILIIAYAAAAVWNLIS